MKLRFKTPPKSEFEIIGNKDTGTLEVFSINDLTTGEVQEYEELSSKLPDNSKEVIQLIAKVMNEEKVPFDKVQKELFSITGEYSELRSKYITDIIALNQNSVNDKFERDVIAACVIAKRLIPPVEKYLENNPSLPESEKEECIGYINALRTCTVEDIKSFHRGHIEALANFYYKENNKGVDPQPLEEQTPDLDDWAGKPSQTIEVVPTGENSSGDSENSGLQMSGSPTNNSLTAPVA